MLKTLWLTGLALTAFAGNSVLARLALIDGAIGAGEFTTVRILSGAISLMVLTGVRKSWNSGTWRGALALLGYATLFSYAYLDLATGTGALILFAAVQITMIGWAILRGERMLFINVAGIMLAMAGLIYLLLPGLERPDPYAAGLMGISGVCWGVYSLLGRGSGDAKTVTSGNFLRASVIVALIAAIILVMSGIGPGQSLTFSTYGVSLAIMSGALTSGLGYLIWYQALKGLSAVEAGVVQLLVPPLAALAGIILLSEPLTLRFLLASAMILFGIALTIFMKRQTSSPTRSRGPS